MPITPSDPYGLARSRGGGIKAYFAFWSIALIAIAALLITVAVLQYRWTEQASTGEEMRIGAELESLIMKWHSDLYNEFSAICVAMQVGPDIGARDTWNDYLERYVEWNYAQPHQTLPNVYRNPELVGEVYILDAIQQPQFRLVHLNLDTRKIEDSSVPPELTKLVPRLQANSASLSMALNAWQLGGAHESTGSALEDHSSKSHSGGDPVAGWQFDESVPAIVHPILHREPGKARGNQSPVDWIIITIDENVLQKKTLPVLANRYFGGMDGLEYRLAVVATGIRPRTIYSSDPGFAQQEITDSDKAMNIFGPALGITTGTPGNPAITSYSLRSAEWRSSIVPSWFPVFEQGANPEQWIFKLQRRAGPVQSIVRRTRERNLGISALVLLLLALNIAVLTSTGFRAQRFATLQMEFVASVSHELRTPLSAIFAAGENLKDGVITDRPGLAQYGAIIMTQARQLMNHIDRILLFASIRSGKGRYSLQPINIADIFRRVREDTASLALDESCLIEMHIEPTATRVIGDSLAIYECLENLVINAIKYSRQQDRRILVSAALEWTESKGYEVAISVADHGMGIKTSELKHIFEPFFRSPEAIGAQIHGTGLGLALAKHLAGAMNGSLSVTSEFGVGSIFTLRLPASRDEEPELDIVTRHRTAGD